MRVVEIDQRVDRIADGVLDPVLPADQRHQLRVRHHLVMQGCERVEQFGVRLAGSFRRDAASPVSSTVPSTSIDPQPHHGVVGVVGDAAAHAGRVVVDHAADLAGGLARRVGPELLVEWLQRPVGVGDDDRRPERDALAVVVDLHLAPAVAEHGEHAVGHRLAGERGAGGAESQRQALGARRLDHGADLVLGVDDDDDGRDQPVGAGVGRIGVGHQRIGHDPVGAG